MFPVTVELSRPHPAGCRAAGVALLALALAACGSGKDGGDGLPNSCSVPDRNAWIARTLDDQYFWFASRPHPSNGNTASLNAFFDASLYTGGDGAFPADRWSYLSSSDDFFRFFSDGQTLGFGVMLAGKEVAGHPELPLKLRYIEPGSPGDVAGLKRGEVVVSANGVAASTIISSDDYSVFSPTAANQALALRVRNPAGVERNVNLFSAIYNLAPVPINQVLTTSAGRKVGYVMVKDMVSQALAPYGAAFAAFQAAGVQDVVIDLRYNGGGLVSVGAELASYPAGSATAGKAYAQLKFNSRHPESNQTFSFSAPSHALALPRVFVLTGQRTCSASEQVVNGLKPFAQVITIGDTSCGKPVGFVPVEDGCGAVMSAVNFESVNASGQGRYVDGITPGCAVAEDFSQPLGQAGEPLLHTALTLADGGACAVASGRAQPASVRRLSPLGRTWKPEPGQREGMIGR